MLKKTLTLIILVFILGSCKVDEELIEDISNKTDDIVENYDKYYSGAIEVKDKIVKGVETTKETINDIRTTLSGSEDTYNEALDKFEQAKKYINNATKTLDDLEKLGEGIKSVVNTGAVK